ncbi:hypothetical protein BHM03_00051180 [Ensete ventricosum]|nr:hypothetical protein BHM03_00051180 [Ensete ventricosum]
MHRNLPSRHRGSRCHLHALIAPLHVITNNHSGCPCSLGHSLLPLQGGWSWPVTPAGGLAVTDYPCKGCGCGRPPLQRAWPWSAAPFLTAFAAKTWQEHVERFYVIQSHHTKFKINLSHENLDSDTTVGKP